MTRKLTRSKSSRMLSGVCAGIAETYDWDVTLIRVIIAVTGIFTAVIPMIIAYIIAVLIIPEA
ncbi:MAG: PspC domain-containing protein [Verrucomicrobiales bacterium]|nr:PspC domain-containing protein [Verrucomicrobiales bacterium]